MQASEFVTPDGAPNAEVALRAQQEAAKRGLLLLTCGPFGNVVRMIPALVVTQEHIDDALKIWADSVAAAQQD
jgi:4-aminobutyrate aminotransferase